MVAEEKIKLFQFEDIVEFTERGIIHNSLGPRNFEAFIFATGYKGQEYMVKKFFFEAATRSLGGNWRNFDFFVFKHPRK